MSVNPYESSLPGGNAPPANAWRTLVKVAFVAGCIILLMLLFAPTRRVRPAAMRNGCLNNLRNITLALHAYQSVHGTFPPAYTVDPEGRRLHSWRTLILPFIEERRLYESIDLSKPWDDPANAHAREAQITVYLCPSSDHLPKLTTYLAVTGPGYAFDGHEPQTFNDTKSKANTACIVDVDSEQAVHWMSPYDTDEKALLALTARSSSNHRRQFIASYVDAHTRVLKLPLERSELRVGTINNESQ